MNGRTIVINLNLFNGLPIAVCVMWSVFITAKGLGQQVKSMALTGVQFSPGGGGGVAGFATPKILASSRHCFQLWFSDGI